MAEVVLVRMIIENFIIELKGAWKYRTEVPGVITDLREEFESLKGFLGDARDRQEDDLVVRKWLSAIKDLNYEAEEVTEKHLHRIARYRQIRQRRWNGIKHFFRTVNDAVVLAREASKIYALTNKISGITSQMKAYGIEYRQAPDPAATTDPIGPAMMMPSYVDNENKDPIIIVGVDEDIKTIEKQLVSVQGSTKVVGICGANGLGKTTLAREVSERGNVKESFDHAIVWAFLGTEFRVVDVLKDILLKLLPGNSEEKRRTADDPDLGEDVLSEKISQILEEKRCLVVLDDLQTSEAWDCLRSAFSSMQGSSHSSSKLLITTCEPKVMSYVDRQGFVHLPRYLNNQEKWELLRKKKAFVGTKGKFFIEGIIGLPLTLLLLGGLIKCNGTFGLYMSTYDRSTDQSFPPSAIHFILTLIRKRSQGVSFPWGQCSGQSLLEWEVEQVLKVSHQTLGRRLRLCLMKMLDYPEGFEIPADELFNKWIDNRVITRWRWSEATKVAQRSLDELVERSLVEVVDKDSSTGKISSCRLHSVVRDFYCNLHEKSFRDILLDAFLLRQEGEWMSSVHL